MKVVFFGTTKFSEEVLKHLLENGVPVSMLFTMNQEFSISYSDKKVKNYNHSDLEHLAKEYRIPLYYIESSETGKKTGDYFQMISDLEPDVILVMGWYYMVPKKIRNLAKFGAWGIHASMLPDYAGGAPLVWAIINGEKETGVTLFRLEDGVDDGDIIVQKPVTIAETDSVKEVYDKVTVISKDILLHALLNINAITFTVQDKSKIKIYPQRKPEDGEIDLKKPAIELYNFIRAQSSPYPGAFIKTIDGKKLIIEKARIE
jgi:methionyl-tRNA formyltransferase